jgi:hypothetical protein
LPPSRKLRFCGGQKARLVGADSEELHHVVEEETISGAFARHMRVAAAQLGVQFVNALFKKTEILVEKEGPTAAPHKIDAR